MKMAGIPVNLRSLWSSLPWLAHAFFTLKPSSFLRRPGQTTVEYLLMLAIVAAVAVSMALLFHRKILGGIFTMVGLIIGAGTPR